MAALIALSARRRWHLPNQPLRPLRVADRRVEVPQRRPQVTEPHSRLGAPSGAGDTVAQDRDDRRDSRYVSLRRVGRGEPVDRVAPALTMPTESKSYPSRNRRRRCKERHSRCQEVEAQNPIYTLIDKTSTAAAARIGS
jgi:hypothetical protein